MIRSGQLADPSGSNYASKLNPSWAWVQHWEFWLALALGAALRLWRIDNTQFVEDQVNLMGLARASVTHGLIPLTSNASSIHTLNPPLTTYLMMPFAITSNPMPLVMSIAIWNVFGVALCYIFTQRYFGRRIAALTTLLFASSTYAITYSRFIWQPNYLPPVIALWALTLYLVGVEGKRRWFAVNVILLAIGALMHSSAALLAPVTVAAAFLAPRWPRLRAWVVSAIVVLALAAPTLLWEAISGFYDVNAARAYTLGPSHITPAIFYYLYLALGSPPITIFGSSLPSYVFNIFAALLFAVGWVVLTARIVQPARALPWRRDASRLAAARTWLAALYTGIRADASWRVNLLLWLCVSVPVALMIRHTGGLTPHYLLSLYPTAFIVSSIGLVSGIEWIVQVARNGSQRSRRLASASTMALEIGVLVLVVARAGQWLSSPSLLVNPASFNAYADYGYPLSVIQGGASELDQVQRQRNATMVEVITPNDPRYRLPADYIFAGERSDRVTVTSSCLLLPSISASESWLITSVAPKAPGFSLVAASATTRPVGTLRMVGGPNFPIYQIAGSGVTVAGSQALSPIFFDDGAGESLQLTSIAPMGTGETVIGWQVVSARVPENQSRYFTVTGSRGSASVSTTCEAQHWQAGERLYTILPLSSGGDLNLKLQSGTHGPDIRVVGGLRFLSALDGGQKPAPMKPEPMGAGADLPQEVINGDNSVTIRPLATP